MNNKKYLLPLLLIVCNFICCKTEKSIYTYQTESLKIEQLSPKTYKHISYLQTKSFGKVPCNGMVVVNKGEAIIIDTPINDEVSKELIDWVEEQLKSKVVSVVVTHFHVDCLGGLNEFHKRKIPSYANNKTIELAKSTEVIIPNNGFETLLELRIGNLQIINEFLGEGHTADNIISYVPQGKVLFGGCLVKSLGSGKGNLDDANIDEWSNSVRAVKERYKEAKVVIPGHGKHGGVELLDYTITKFEKNKN